MGELSVTWQRVLKIWWCLLWRSAVIAGLVGFGFVGIVLFFLTGEASLSNWVVNLIGNILGVLVSIWVIKPVLENKKFSDFRIVLISTRRTEALNGPKNMKKISSISTNAISTSSTP